MKNFQATRMASKPSGVAVQHQSVGLMETDFQHPEMLTFDRFDSAMGTLNTVLISCEARAMLTGSVKNHSTSSERFTVTVAVEVAFATPPGLPPTALQATPSISAMFSLPPGQSVEIPWNAGIDQRVVVLSTPADLAIFSGPGRWRLQASTATSHGIMGGGGNIESSVCAKAAFDIVVQYEFTPMPAQGRDGKGLSPAGGAKSDRQKASARPLH